jgi:hypothetical protein
MAIKKGKNAKVSVGATAVGHLIGEISYEISDTDLDTTDRDATGRTYEMLGWPTATLSFEAQYDIADTGQDALRAAVLAGTSQTINLFPEGNTSGLPKFSGTMVITSSKVIGAPMDGMITMSCSCKGAPLTEATV